MVNSLNGTGEKQSSKISKSFNDRSFSRNKKFLNYGEEDEMEIQGFVFDKVKTYLIWALYALTLGLLRLFFHWFPKLHLKATHSRCSLKEAEKVLVTDSYKKFKSFFVKSVQILDSGSVEGNLNFNLWDGRQRTVKETRIIRIKKLVYVWDDEKENFIKLSGFDRGITHSELHSFTGQSKENQILRRIIYGSNEINVPVQTILTLLVLEALTPFYIFQLFSLIVWICEYYLPYTIAIILMSVVGISTSIIQTRRNQKNLRGTVNTKDTILVSRGIDVFEEILTTDLVPGDIIMIPKNGCEMQCDAVLLNSSCVVNESMLTGESVPITKTPLPNNFSQLDLKEDINHILFCGTKIIQTRAKRHERVYALVIRTGYLTTKGDLVRSILYPPPADFKFEKDSYKFIGILAGIAFISVIYTVVSKTISKINPIDILVKSLDVITIAVPPALPAAMTVGKLYALNRLKKCNIFCINSRVINVSGSVDCICFDKTGTLTEDELDMKGVVPVENDQTKDLTRNVGIFPCDSLLLRGMATCHSLSIINSELGGDPLDVKMFESTEWSLKDAEDENHNIIVKPREASTKDHLQISIVKQFQFSSTLQRMSVIVQPSDTLSYRVFCKGSPEMIMSLSRPASVPDDLTKTLSDFTRQGYRVIAMGTKLLDDADSNEVEKLQREEVERELEFVGLIVLENKLKPQTSGIIHTLKNADLKVVMITGDNIQTAVHVARDCQMVDPEQYILEVIAKDASQFDAASLNYEIIAYPKLEDQYNGKSMDLEKAAKKKYCFAITGKSWANLVTYFPDMIPRIVAKGIVFARMSGLQKQQLIEEFKGLGYYVAMCGDGANDCGALKAAHVGISLSEAESSVASPFTSKEQNISCVPQVIKEGRAALVTSFGVFKVMLCYSLTELMSVLILYYIDSNLGSIEFLFIDIALILNFASLFGITDSYPVLSKTPPMSSLMAFIPICSMTLFMVVVTAFEAFAFHWIKTYPWFTPFVLNPNEQKFVSYENFAVFTVSMFQYIAMVIVFSKGKPYRKPIYTNVPFMLSIIVTTMICLYMTLIPHQWVVDLIELKMPPMEARYAMIIIAVFSSLACWITEDFIVDVLLAKVIAPRFASKEKKFYRVLSSVEDDTCWPDIGSNEIVVKELKEGEKNGVDNKGFVGSQDGLVTKC